MANPDKTATELLVAVVREEASEAELLTVLYGELRQVAGRLLRAERSDHTLEATALVHEAWARMVDVSKLDRIDADGARRRFLSLAARSMRRVLIDHARRRQRDKRGGGWQRVTLSSGVIAPEVSSADVLDIDSAFEALEAWNPRLARIAELRLFAGLDHQSVADALQISVSTATDEWALAKALLAERLSERR